MSRVQLVDGADHITFLTEDMDRLHEVILQRSGFADSEMLERADWTTVMLD